MGIFYSEGDLFLGEGIIRGAIGDVADLLDVK